jgi:hypothetical protein
VLVTQRDDDYRATGLVPDGVTAIQINYFDGSSEAVAIRDNGFHLHLRGQLMNLTYRDGAGSHTTEPASL